ncbi:MAG: DUF1501 domain-containing protein [Bacteroidota bacterium]
MWTRRDFLAASGLLAAGATVTLGGTPVRAMGHAPLLHALSSVENDRVLVLVQLKGGNDGLNSVVPVRDDLYYRARPTLSLSRAQTRPLDPDFGLNGHLDALMRYWERDRMAIVQSVGYPSPNLSHFVSTDTWLTGEIRDATPLQDTTTGWLGRLNDALYPPSGPFPDAPPAVQVGTRLPLLGAGLETNLMMSLKDAQAVDTLAERGILYDPDAVPEGSYGPVLSYLRSVANLSERYVAPVQAAAQAASTGEGYPSTTFADNLAVVARLIKGRLGAKTYVVSLGNFDTHGNQLERHTRLCTELAEGVHAFFGDLERSGDAKRVVLMTFSEFGRRVYENGSGGTDHGEASVVFLLGGDETVGGGLYGEPPDLTGENVPYQEDFRSLYGILLRDWLGVQSDIVASGTSDSAALTGLIQTPFSTTPSRSADALAAVYPNPATSRVVVEINLAQRQVVRLDVVDLRGRVVHTAAERTIEPGLHRVPMMWGRLAAGVYTVRLRTSAGTSSRTVSVIR